MENMDPILDSWEKEVTATAELPTAIAESD
jgi:hypothetical protein